MPTSPAYLSINLGVNELGRLLPLALFISGGTYVDCVRCRKGQVRADVVEVVKPFRSFIIVSREGVDLII